MSKTGIRISNRLGTVTNEYDSQDLRVTIIEPSGAEVIAYHTEGQGNAPAADTSASGNAAAGALLGGGSGGYAGGGVGGAAPETAQTMNVQDIAFVPGGVTHVPYPQGNQKRYRITGVVPGPGCFEFTVAANNHSGGGRFSLTGAEIDACPIVRAVYATERGVFVGPSILEEYGQRNHFSEAFVVGKPGGGGYGPELPTDKPTDVNVEFAAGVPSNITCEIAAHDR